MSEQFTPGPWRVDSDEAGDVDKVVAANGLVVADVLFVTMPQAEVEANARLIAAARDYHAAAVMVVEQCKNIDDPIARRIQRIFEPIIAKARGEQP